MSEDPVAVPGSEVDPDADVSCAGSVAALVELVEVAVPMLAEVSCIPDDVELWPPKFGFSSIRHPSSRTVGSHRTSRTKRHDYGSD